MRTRMTFQYLAPGAKVPDDHTIVDALHGLDAGEPVPNIGDIVTIVPKPPSEGPSGFRAFKVVARNLLYSYGGEERSELVDCVIFVIVTDPEENDITDFAQ